MDNIPGFSGYYVSKRGRVYTRRRVGLGRKSNVIKIIILRIIFIKIFTGVLNLRIFNNVLKMGDINHAN